MGAAATNGRLAVVQWLYEHGIEETSSNAMKFAAANGHLDYVKYRGSVCSDVIIIKAAEGGHLEVVQWLCQRSSGCCVDAMDAATANGHLEVIQWLYAKMKRQWQTIFSPSRACTFAARNGHLEVMKWVRGHYGTRFSCCFTLANDVASRGHLHILKWMRDVGTYYATKNAMNGAAANGHLDVVHTTCGENCTEAAMNEAAGNGHLTLVQWLHEHRREGCTTNAMDSAASNGHLDVIRWLDEYRPQGCYCQAFVDAAKNVHVEVVRWLYENYKFSITTVMEAGSGVGRFSLRRQFEDD